MANLSSYVKYKEEKSKLQGLKRDAKLFPHMDLSDQIRNQTIMTDIAKRNACIESPQEEWQCESFYNGFHSVNSGHLFYGITKLWFANREIRIYRQKGITAASAKAIEKGIEHLLDQVGLDFKVLNLGHHPTIDEELNMARTEGKVDVLDFGSVLYNESYREEKPHADIVLLENINLRKRTVIPRSFGIGSYIGGYVLIWSGFESKTAVHEGGHLFGIPRNHGEEGMKKFANYYDTSDCTMNWHIPSGKLCAHCLDFLRYFWKGIEHSTKQKFLID